MWFDRMDEGIEWAGAIEQEKRIERDPNEQDRAEDDDERPRAAERGDLVGEALPECALVLKLAVRVATDVRALNQTLDDAPLTLGQLVPFLTQKTLGCLLQMLTH